MLSKDDVGNRVFLIKWDRSNREAGRVLSEGILNKFGRVKITIDNLEYRIQCKKDFCMVLSRGSVSDHYVEVYKSKDDINKENDAAARRNDLATKFSEQHFLRSLSLDKVNDILKIVHM